MNENSLTFQQRVQPWLMACFGAMIAGDREERNHRFLEEALELVQSCGCSSDEAHQLVDYVFGRPIGEPDQEVGGVMVTLAALCLANGLDMHSAGNTELARIWTKVEQIRAKQAAKPKYSPLPVASDTAEDAADIEAAQLALQEYREKGGTSLADIKAELASDTAALPSGYEGLVERLKQVASRRHTISHDAYGAKKALGIMNEMSAALDEAIAALGRVEPIAVKPIGYARSIDTTERPMEGRNSFWCSERQSAYYDTPIYTTPPAQPALALIEELERALERIRKQDRVTRFRGTEQQFYEDGPSGQIARTALASAKRFKGE